ncbi:MAG: response regulator transcription factor [Gammaproteobacteria bacterium]|jgi:two-component system, OmpR family, KDP operon response regulator KdpE|nr:response regulator transcription factor [Gammaproteobacteria bacterium]MBU2280820.1 response regulator transcription factor [Gammaproteobacteria bacterium]MBU2426706.1 response regulator transcription factor [Gammaproteobacteria bacterium]
MNLQALIVEDDLAVQSFLQTLLQSQNFTVQTTSSGQQCLQLLCNQNVDLVLLDLGLADLDGQLVLQQLRQWTAVPVIVISARGKEQDKIQALDSGANDYITKPFSAGELLARIRAALRQHQGSVQTLQFGDVEIDPIQRLILKNGTPLHLTKTEYDILLLLLKHAGSVLTHNQILRQVWGEMYQGRPEYVRVHMATLRQKIEDNPATPQFIKTEAGVGYRFSH